VYSYCTSAAFSVWMNALLVCVRMITVNKVNQFRYSGNSITAPVSQVGWLHSVCIFHVCKFHYLPTTLRSISVTSLQQKFRFIIALSWLYIVLLLLTGILQYVAACCCFSYDFRRVMDTVEITHACSSSTSWQKLHRRMQF